MTQQGNIGREMKRHAAIRHDFGRKAARMKRGPPRRVTSAASQSSLQLLLTPVASEHFNPADRHRSTASNNQPEIRRKRGQANCHEAATKERDISRPRQRLRLPADERRFAVVSSGVSSTGGRCGTDQRGGPRIRTRLASLSLRARLERVIRPRRVRRTGCPRVLMPTIA